MINWLLNLGENGPESYLKLFHRVALGKLLFKIMFSRDFDPDHAQA